MYLFQESNYDVVENKLCPAVVQNKLLGSHQTGQLVMFMVEHSWEIFLVPDSVEQSVQIRISHMIDGHNAGSPIGDYL